jgi:Zn-dependent protease with chaperone function
MGAIILYIITLLLELISVLVRFALVAGAVGFAFGRDAGVIAGALAGLAPVISSLAALAGLPRGHMLTRLEVRGRPLTGEERRLLDKALARPRALGIPVPRRVFAVDREGLNAFIAGRTLYIYRDLFWHEGLEAVVAHELGHYNSMDGRLSGAIFGLTLPGGFLITYMLLRVLQWVAYGLFLLLVGLFVGVFLLMGLNVWGLLRSLFGLAVTLTRFAIIFAVGGVGTVLLGSVWRAYFVEREFAADAYAARLGHAQNLIAFFEREVLSDMNVPWSTQPTHPPTTRRIQALEQFAGPVRSPQPAASQRPVARVYHTGAEPGRTPRTGIPSSLASVPATIAPSTAWLLPLTVAAGIVGATLLAFALLSGSVELQTNGPSLAPTPTLGLPGD